jgi:hypothetical protein
MMCAGARTAIIDGDRLHMRVPGLCRQAYQRHRSSDHRPRERQVPHALTLGPRRPRPGSGALHRPAAAGSHSCLSPHLHHGP